MQRLDCNTLAPLHIERGKKGEMEGEKERESEREREEGEEVWSTRSMQQVGTCCGCWQVINGCGQSQTLHGRFEKQLKCVCAAPMPARGSQLKFRLGEAFVGLAGGHISPPCVTTPVGTFLCSSYNIIAPRGVVKGCGLQE